MAVEIVHETGLGLWHLLVQLVLIVFFVGVVTLVVSGLINLFRGGTQGGRRWGSSDPEQILKERLARGEIDPEEYLRLRDLISEDHTRRQL